VKLFAIVCLFGLKTFWLCWYDMYLARRGKWDVVHYEFLLRKIYINIMGLISCVKIFTP